jgi:hypothetical protein
MWKDELMRQVTGSTLTTYTFLVSKMYVYMISWQTPANLWDGDDCIYRISSDGRQYGRHIVAIIHVLYIYQGYQILKVGMISTITVQI